MTVNFMKSDRDGNSFSKLLLALNVFSFWLEALRW